MTDLNHDEIPKPFKKSNIKIRIRTVILLVFGTLFMIALIRDCKAGIFCWKWGLMIFIPFLIIGFWMRKLVPMQVHLASKCITFSFDKIYFSIILLLVIIKAVTGHIPVMVFWSDVIMCIILGLMIGRLSGICLRVRDLKKSHNLFD